MKGARVGPVTKPAPKTVNANTYGILSARGRSRAGSPAGSQDSRCVFQNKTLTTLAKVSCHSSEYQRNKRTSTCT